MASRSTLARMQQAVTLALLAVSILWLAACWNRSPTFALIGAVLIAMNHSLFLAFEFFILWRLGRRGVSLPAGAREICRAWWRETIEAVRTFYWRQPYRWNADADHLTSLGGPDPRRGVVLVHGFICNRGFWIPWMKRLGERDHCFVAVNLEPVFGSIESYVPIIDAAVKRVTLTTGKPPVVVCHSMGGLAVRAWLATQDNMDCVDHVFTIATPHAGTWLARFSLVMNGRQMRIGSKWLESLRRAEHVGMGRKFTCWYTNCDNVVFPVQTATLPGACNRLVRGPAHVDLAFDALVLEDTLAFISRPDTEAP